jgi:hypothetical protein
MKCKVKLTSSLEKVFFDQFEHIPEVTSGSMFKNEIYSFQLVTFGEHAKVSKQTCELVVESELLPYIQVKEVTYVPSLLPARVLADDDYLTRTPGLFPDPLHTITDGKIDVVNGQTRAAWVSVEPKEEITGNYPITCKVLNGEGTVLAEATFAITILPAVLPQLSIYNTCWFHGDCLAELHHVEMMSDAYWKIVEKYMKVFVKFGHNMILTPIFTPPLDTEVGSERPTNQLVDVFVENREYRFEFAKLKKWIDLSHKCGIRYFEMAHFFTQWGAYHAPKIMATVNGEYKKIFGWETDALSAEYKEFLDVFLLRLIAFLKEENIFEDCMFHVSDEPREEHEEQYRNVKAVLLKHLESDKIMDALSDYSFYEKGTVTMPVVSTKSIHDFLEHGVKNMWAYYCTSEGQEVANRFMAMPSYRNRILGYQLYKYDIKGFLQWGYNFWFTELSKGVVNPYLDTTAGGGFQSGDPFVVYPLDTNGEVVCSLRLYVFNEALQDMRALKLLESLTDRETVQELLEEIVGFKVYPRRSDYILQLRETVNRMIKERQDEISI